MDAQENLDGVSKGEGGCACWFNKRNDLILCVWDCPEHGERTEHLRIDKASSFTLVQRNFCGISLSCGLLCGD